MLYKKDFLNKYPDTSELYDAYTNDGQRLGKIMTLDDDNIRVQKGDFFPRDFTLRYDEIADVKNKQLILKYSKKDFEIWKDENYKGWKEYDEWTVPSYTGKPEVEPGRKEPENVQSSSDVRIPLHEEELEAQKYKHQTGEVRLRKIVHTETKSFTVPVSKEEVVVEKLPPEAGKEDLKGTGKEFVEEEVKIPVMEEDVELLKKQKQTGEVRAHKEVHTEQEKVSGEARKENVDIDKKDKGFRKAA